MYTAYLFFIGLLFTLFYNNFCLENLALFNKYSFALFLLVIIFSIISIFTGVLDVSMSGIFAGDFQQIEILLISRLPRLMAILCTGMGMSVAGLIMQNLCMNKFVSPTTGSTIAFAQLGVLLAIMFFKSATLWQRTSIAFISSILGTWLFVYITQKIKLKDVVMVPLIGIMLGNIVSGVTTHLAYTNDLTQALSSVLVGDFSLIIRGRYEIVFLVMPLLVIAYIYANHFNIVGMGEDFSKNLGVHYQRILVMGLSIAALITASVVVTVGSISYLGLIVPNIVAMFRGDKIRGSIVDVALFGALFVLICDILGRLLIRPYELPIELISGVIGSVIFLVLMFKRLSPNSGGVKSK